MRRKHRACGKKADVAQPRGGSTTAAAQRRRTWTSSDIAGGRRVTAHFVGAFNCTAAQQRALFQPLACCCCPLPVGRCTLCISPFPRPNGQNGTVKGVQIAVETGLTVGSYLVVVVVVAGSDRKGIGTLFRGGAPAQMGSSRCTRMYGLPARRIGRRAKRRRRWRRVKFGLACVLCKGSLLEYAGKEMVWS